MRTGTETVGERIASGGLALLTGAVLVFLVAPIVIMVPLSFSSGSFFYYPLPGLSLRWYEDFFTSSFWLPALKNSLIVGVSATVLATGLGTLAALGIWRARFPAQALVLAILISPMIVPVVIVAVGAYFAFAPLGLTDGYLGLILAHATLGVPFVVITVLATLSAFDRTLIRAAESLGASQLKTFRASLPLIHRGGLGRGVRVRRFVRRSRGRALMAGPGRAASAADVRRHQRQHQFDDRGRGDDAGRHLAAADDRGELAAAAQRADATKRLTLPTPLARRGKAVRALSIRHPSSEARRSKASRNRGLGHGCGTAPPPPDREAARRNPCRRPAPPGNSDRRLRKAMATNRARVASAPRPVSALAIASVFQSSGRVARRDALNAIAYSAS
jgi:putative spermidine/putrescine transport system permease protein